MCTYNLSILDFKGMGLDAYWFFVCTYNLSILDFKSILHNMMNNTVQAYNLSILDFKSMVVHTQIFITVTLIIYPYWILNLMCACSFSYSAFLIIYPYWILNLQEKRVHTWDKISYNLSILDFK